MHASVGIVSICRCPQFGQVNSLSRIRPAAMVQHLSRKPTDLSLRQLKRRFVSLMSCRNVAPQKRTFGVIGRQARLWLHHSTIDMVGRSAPKGDFPWQSHRRRTIQRRSRSTIRRSAIRRSTIHRLRQGQGRRLTGPYPMNDWEWHDCAKIPPPPDRQIVTGQRRPDGSWSITGFSPPGQGRDVHTAGIYWAYMPEWILKGPER
jgi:hypothetical protein